MAPMIDMVFLLLVFFMCVSSLSQAGHRVSLDLPESTASEIPKDLSGRLIVSIQEEGQVYIGGVLIEMDDVAARLSELSERFPGIKLRIRADRGTRFEAIRRVMSQASEAGISDYIYGTVQGE